MTRDSDRYREADETQRGSVPVGDRARAEGIAHPSSALTPAPAPNDSGLVERIGNAIERAWNSDCAEAEGLPPISLIESERDYLARAVLTQLSAAPSSGEVERIIYWLRHDLYDWPDYCAPADLADAIERGDYRQALSPPSQEEQS